MKAAKHQEDLIFYAALEITDRAERERFLDQACAGDEVLRGAVVELLSAEAAADSFFAKGSRALALPTDAPLEADAAMLRGKTKTSDLAADEQVGTRIDRYRLVQKLGEGGCGAVYLAEQEEPVRRRVAIKVIKLGMDTANVIARFEAERQALAMMDHPNIARVLDAGATETGRPYFVMELVTGTRITDYCDQNHLDTRQRLDLFVQICHAIQHAHQKGIIHRDIKPSNILVTLHDNVPVPKVIDFGIAKATQGRLTDQAATTACAQLIGTPAYMSPEQADRSGVDVDTRSDIYSLGVLLYELLTGRTPFDGKKLVQSGLEEMLRTLREKEPERPSALLTTFAGAELTATSQHRHIDAPKLVSLLRGDLDWIVMKALEKDRRCRYETANALATDVLCYLNHEPVVARPPSRLYRLRKLVRRNQGVFAAAAAVAAALISGLGTSTWLFLQERGARREQARLRVQAEVREKITQAAMLVGLQRFQEADDLLRRVPPLSPSLEAAIATRSLGEWHALQGQWQQAAEWFSTLLQVNEIENWDRISGDFLEAGPPLVEVGDKDGYERFRRAVVARTLGTTDPIAAERTVKICLLLPADRNLLESLAPLAQVAAKSLDTPGTKTDYDLFLAAWRCISLQLIAYRNNDFLGAQDWGRRCLTYYPTNPVRAATARVILALAGYQLHQFDEADAQLAEAGAAIDGKFQTGLGSGSSEEGFWSDWLFARILLREARTLIEEHSAPDHLTPASKPDQPNLIPSSSLYRRPQRS